MAVLISNNRTGEAGRQSRLCESCERMNERRCAGMLRPGINTTMHCYKSLLQLDADKLHAIAQLFFNENTLFKHTRLLDQTAQSANARFFVLTVVE